MNYRDGQELRNGDRVWVVGFDRTEFVFEVQSWRGEGVAIIKNMAPGFDATSTVPIKDLVLAQRGRPCAALSPTGKRCREVGKHYWHIASTGAGSESWRVRAAAESDVP